MKNPMLLLLLVILVPLENKAQNIYGFAEKYFVSFNPYTEEADTLIEFQGPPHINLDFRTAIDRYNGRYFFGGTIPGYEGNFHIIDLNTLGIESFPLNPENIEYDFLHNKLPYEKGGSFYSLDLKTMTTAFLSNIENENGVIFGQIRTYVPQRNEYVYLDYQGGKPYYLAIDATTGEIKCRELSETSEGGNNSAYGLVTNNCTGEIIGHQGATFGFVDPCEPNFTKLSHMENYYSDLNSQLCVYDHNNQLYIVPFVTDDPDYPNFYSVVDPYNNFVVYTRNHPFNGRMEHHQIYDKPMMPPLIYLNDTLFVPWGRNYTWYRDGHPIAYTFGDENYWVPTYSGLYTAKVEFNAYTAISKAVQITITGTTEGAKEKALYLYPNPAVDEINIQLQSEGAERIEITDMTGRVVDHMFAEKGVNDLLTLDIRMLPQGTYVVTVFAKGDKYVGRFVKM